MKKSIVAAIAMLGGVAIAAPMLAWSADPSQQSDQAAPAGGPAGDGGPGMARPDMPGRGMMGWGHAHWDRGGPGAQGDWAGMHRWAMMRRPPQERCQVRLAHRAAMVAYTVTRLDLTTAQRPLWEKVNSAIQAGTEKQQQLCDALKDVKPEEQTMLDRVSRQEQVLSARLQTLQQAQPALQQFYQSLTAEQKDIFDHPFRRG
jgi:flagellar capping protein FliD